MGCGASDETADEPAVAARSEKVVLGLERLIPIEAVYVRTTGEVTPPDFVERMERGTAVTNQIFGATGIQFMLRSAKAIQAPDLAAWRYPDPGNGVPGDFATPVRWGVSGPDAVRDELDAFFGLSVFPSRLPAESLHRQGWLSLAISAYGKQDAIYVVVGSTFNKSSGPPESRVFFMSYNDLGLGWGLMGHEMGHFLGLNHPWESGFTNPRTQAPLGLADYWDLVYCPGTSSANPPVVFTNAQAAANGCPPGTGPMRLKMGSGDIAPAYVCNGDPLNVSCSWAPGAGAVAGYGASTFGHSSAQLQGSISFQGSGGPADRGANAMSYLPMSPATAFSPSQIQVLRDTLRYDRRVSYLPDNDLCLSGGGSYCVYNNAVLGRPSLGVATQSRPPLHKLDVNGDGLRDLVLWRVDSAASLGSNNATFTVFYAPTFACSETASFGRPGDIPTVMDFDNDGRVDQGLYRPDEALLGGPLGQGRWYWCPSVAAAPVVSGTCSSPPAAAGRLGQCAGGGWGTAAFGARGDVPLPQARLGTTPQLAVYRPDTATFYWGPAPNPYPYAQRQVAGVLAGRAHTLALDDYDGDGFTDLATYDTKVAWAAISYSSTGFSSALGHYRFPSAYQAFDVPNPDPGTPILPQRAGGLVLVGARNETYGTTPPLFLPYRTRGTLTLWDPGTATACSVRNAAGPGSSSVVFACDASGTSVGTTTTLGSVGDIPLGGLKATGPASAIAALAYIHFDAAGAVTLERRTRSTSTTTSLPSRPLVGVNARGGASFVADMGQDGTTGGGTGADNLPELVIQGVNPGTWHVYWSNTDYQTRTTVTTGSMLSHML